MVEPVGQPPDEVSELTEAYSWRIQVTYCPGS